MKRCPALKRGAAQRRQACAGLVVEPETGARALDADDQALRRLGRKARCPAGHHRSRSRTSRMGGGVLPAALAAHLAVAAPPCGQADPFQLRPTPPVVR